ncbi:MAG: helix-turn-helix domain-containing protein [Candidatus Jordarchaeaceae archaeon]
MAGILKNGVWKVLTFLVSGSRYPSGIFEELGMSRKTVFRTVKVLKEAGLIDVFSSREERVGRPREYLSVTERGWRLLQFVEELKLHRIRSHFKKLVFGPGYSLLEYGVPLVNFNVEVFTEKEFETQKSFEEDIKVFVWRDEDVYRRCKISSFEPRIPLLSIEDTILGILLFMRNARYVEAIPTLIALNSGKIDFEYLFVKGKHYDLVEIIGAFLDIADYLNPCREIKRGSSPFRKARSYKTKQVFPSIKTGGRFSEALKETLGKFFDPIEVYSWYWNVEGLPALDEFIKFFETYR